MLEANHFRRIAQLALDFNVDAKMAYEGETAPQELESLNRRVCARLELFASLFVLTATLTVLSGSEEIWPSCWA
jgi:hypothetical protein